MRAAIDLEKIGPRTIWLDCDVLQADGGTRTAAITGIYVALALAMRSRSSAGKFARPSQTGRRGQRGIVESRALLDLSYVEDVAASVDMDLVMNGAGEFIELQGTGEESTPTRMEQLAAMLCLEKPGSNNCSPSSKPPWAEVRDQFQDRSSGESASHRSLPSFWRRICLQSSSGLGWKTKSTVAGWTSQLCCAIS